MSIILIIGFLLPALIVAVYFSINFKVPLSSKSLVHETPLYIDRSYFIEGGHPLIGNSVVIQIPRHLLTPVYLRLSAQARVVRLLSDVNTNIEFSEWQPDTISILASGSDFPGNRNNLTQAVYKELDEGVWKLPPGGPKFSSPILIQSSGDVSAHTVRFFNKIVSPLSRNKKKILGAFVFIVMGDLLAFILYRFS